MSAIIASHWMRKNAVRILGLVWLAIIVCGCHSFHSAPTPSIEFTQVPHAGAGGPDQVELIGGRVTGAQPGQKIVIYAHSGVWWVQPTKAHPFTVIQPDSSWKNTTHLGTDYAALVVDGTYDPASRVVSVPNVGKGVLAVAASPGKPGPRSSRKSFTSAATTGRFAVQAATAEGRRIPMIHPTSGQMNTGIFTFTWGLAMDAGVARRSISTAASDSGPTDL